MYCDWLSPCYVATLPVTAYEPLSLTCQEHSAGENSFLQLLLHNTCPLPLLLKEPQLTTSVRLQQLHGPLPQVKTVGDCVCEYECVCVQVFFPLESHSFLWKVQPSTFSPLPWCALIKTPPSHIIVTPGRHMIQDQTESSFAVQFSCLPLDFDWDEDKVPDDPAYVSTQFNFTLSNMQASVHVSHTYF